jgi:glycosyltransferase involved in cell wall biosynthesis
MTSSQLIIAVMPEGPIAFDGVSYRYSKGERLYLDNLAQHFREVWLISLVFREGDEGYETCLHSPFEAKNIKIIELPKPDVRVKVGVGGKLLQLAGDIFLLCCLVPKVDLLYLFLPSYHSAMGWMVGRLFRKPHVVYGADDWVQASASMFKWEHLRDSWFYSFYAYVNELLERWIVGSAKFGVAAGGQLQEKYARLGCAVHPTSPRMTLTRSDIRERSDTCCNPEIRLITVGALIHDKAQHFMIEALAQLVAKFPQLRMDIIGAGPERKRLEQLARDLGVAEVVDFKGYVEDEQELYSLLQGADIFILSSVTEGFPRAIYEALAMRLPVVTTSVGGIPYLLRDGINARVVPAGDCVSLANAVDDIIANGDQRRRLIREGATTLEEVFQRLDPVQIARLTDEWLAKDGARRVVAGR